MERDDWPVEFKVRDSPGVLCSWSVLWYICSLNYFPQGFYLSLFPDFTPMTAASQPDTKKTKSKGVSYVNVQLTLAELRLAVTKQRTTKLQEELVLAALSEHKRVSTLDVQLNETDQILADAKCMQYHVTHIEFLKYMERQERANYAAEERTGLIPSRTPVAVTSPHCQVCGEKEARDEDQLVQCAVRTTQGCAMQVHAGCYGMEEKEEDWYCEVCKEFDQTQRENVSCALCPVKGGALKPTIHAIDSAFASSLNVTTTMRRKRTRSHSKPDLKDFLWCHVFCASRLDKVKFIEAGIDLSAIDAARFQQKCEICKTRNGATVSCAHAKCPAAFHPECGKGLFVYTRSEENSYEYRIYCSQHRPLKLRQILETRDRKFVDDLYKFAKVYERWEIRQCRGRRPQSRKRRDLHMRNTVPRNFTQDEDQALEFRLFSFLKRLQRRNKEPFLINVNLSANTRRSRVSVSHPPFFSMVSPEVILEERLTIDDRTPEECFKRYSDILMNKLKNELLLNGQRVALYCGRDPNAIRLYRKKTSGRRSRPKRIIPAEDVTSVEKYCICNRPFVYVLSTKNATSEQQYDQSLEENHMIGCSECDGWFHMKCVKYPGDLEAARKDESWLCPLCVKRLKPDRRRGGLGQEDIIGEYEKGVCTRRQLVSNSNILLAYYGLRELQGFPSQ